MSYATAHFTKQFLTVSYAIASPLSSPSLRQHVSCKKCHIGALAMRELRKTLHSSFCEQLCLHTSLLAAPCAETYRTATPGARLCADQLIIS